MSSSVASVEVGDFGEHLERCFVSGVIISVLFENAENSLRTCASKRTSPDSKAKFLAIKVSPEQSMSPYSSFISLVLLEVDGGGTCILSVAVEVIPRTNL